MIEEDIEDEQVAKQSHPGNGFRTLNIGSCQDSIAVARSLMRSSESSIPTLNRMRLSGTARGELATLAWVITPGCSISDSTPPRLSASKNSFVFCAIRLASSNPPLT